jgi:putative Ca2+/H+ antiporter (TMEM165/GDT1 family)
MGVNEQTSLGGPHCTATPRRHVATFNMASLSKKNYLVLSGTLQGHVYTHTFMFFVYYMIQKQVDAKHMYIIYI